MSTGPDPLRDEWQDMAGETRPRIELVSDAALEAMPLPEYLVQDVIIVGTLVHMIGAPGSGKSFAALDIAAHIRLGLPWHGRAVSAGPVVYVLAEGARSYGGRIRAWRSHHQRSEPIGLHYVIMPVQLGEPAEVRALLTAIATLDTPPRLIVIDTQARCSIGLDENSATDMGRLIAGAERIVRETGAAVILVHHTPRDAERERGSTAQRGAVDTTLLVQADGDHVTMRIDRQKDGEAGAVLAWRRRIVEVDDTGRTSCVLVPVTDEERQRPRGVGDLTRSVRAVLQALRITAAGGMRTTELARATELAERTHYRAVRSALDLGLIELVDGRYRLSAAGRELLMGGGES